MIRQENVSFLPYIYNIIDCFQLQLTIFQTQLFNILCLSLLIFLPKSAFCTMKEHSKKKKRKNIHFKVHLLLENSFILKFIFWGENFFASQSCILTWILLLYITINGNSVGQCHNISLMSCKLPPMTITSK